MGQKKGLVYNFVVINLLLAIWYLTTSNAGYSAPELPNIPFISSELTLYPTIFSLIISTEDEFEIPSDLVNSLENISNAYSNLWDLRVTLSKVNTLDPKKLKTMSVSSIHAKTLIFVISPQYQDFHKENCFWVPSNDIQKILKIFVSVLRNTSGLPLTNEPLVNGLTVNEWKNIDHYAVEWIKSSLNKEIELYNKLNNENQPIIDKKAYNQVLKVSTKLKYSSSSDELYELLRAIQSFNTSPDFAKAEYFQWDFKLGVYAPLFFPVLFPMSAAIYSRLFLRK